MNAIDRRSRQLRKQVERTLELDDPPTRELLAAAHCLCCARHGTPRMFHSTKGECTSCGWGDVCMDARKDSAG